MRLLVQIAAIFAFILASSQFSHGHELVGAMKPHGHAIAIADHHDEISPAIEQNGTVHCGAHLVLLVANNSFTFPVGVQAFESRPPKLRSALQLTFDPPPPRA